MEGTVEETAGQGPDCGGEALHRADEFLQDTKGHVSEAGRAGGDSSDPRD